MKSRDKMSPDIPEDFPIGNTLAALSGTQPKLSLVLGDDGNYYAPGATPEDVRDDYENCIDLQQQMVEYCKRKIAAAPGTEAEILKTAFKKFLMKEYCSTFEQTKWLFDRLAGELGWAPVDDKVPGFS